MTSSPLITTVPESLGYRVDESTHDGHVEWLPGFGDLLQKFLASVNVFILVMILQNGPDIFNGGEVGNVGRPFTKSPFTKSPDI